MQPRRKEATITLLQHRVHDGSHMSNIRAHDTYFLFIKALENIFDAIAPAIVKFFDSRK